MKRFYKQATVTEQDGMFTVELDGRGIKTPAKEKCLMPTRKMAEVVAEEWNEQGEEVDPHSMPITKLMNTAIDRVEARRDELIAELVKYAGSDQLCYRVEHPAELVEEQNKIWNPLLERMKEKYGINFKLASGIIFENQDDEAIDTYKALIDGIESFELTAYHGMTTVTGSVTIGLHLFDGHLTVDEAWDAGHVDENFQASQWGIDEEAEERRKELKTELGNAARFLSLCR
ncbi:ATP12 family chaperone protein [Pseudemcibacter aquimaris]|uniref:ATP12 family chaperone protein n=1 Tax=Pseudemcibacter aquimaris TaxID=2857064 RepID=UPI0020125209|nr:ATP12 family protein [Pseudemcibacter aquimaris]MCC3860458.1 hypothetical protein [Pseudemcibacter aquimaris]WDU59283.1 hypothetical protein KW060_03270 [Pseudemcibacter aquimaris]